MEVREEPAQETEPRAGRSWRERLPRATPAILAYVLVRALGLLVLWVFASRAGTDIWYLLSKRYDSAWYAGVAEYGYDAAMRPKDTVVLGHEFVGEVLDVSWSAGIACAWGMYAIGAHLHSHRTGVLLAACWGVMPHAVVQNMAYTETVFTALAAWTLYCVLRRRWIAAGLICLVAGLSRPTSTALIAAVCVAALVAIVRRRDGWRPWVALAVSGLGYAGYVAWVGHRLGRWDGYFYVLRDGWFAYVDGGRKALSDTVHVLTTPTPLAYYAVAVVLGTALALLVLSILDRQPLPLLIYSSAYLMVTVLTAGSYFVKGRLMLPAFTLLLPLAIGLSRMRPRNRWAVLSALALASAWYGTYLTLDWIHSP